jgi:redox-sensitive bicupin YhaK (pirin superfamily)
MNTILHKANTRGRADHGWLKTNYTFSFADYYDPERVNFGTLRVLNDDFIDGGMGFGKHPHDNMEIVTIMLDGELKHGDSMGHTQVLKKNEVQVMSAGTGIFHSEYNNLPDKPLRLLQIWVFPEHKNIQPRYDQKEFDPKARINEWQTIAAPTPDNGALEIKQNAWFSMGALDKGKNLDYALHNNKNGIYIFVIEGSVYTAENILLNQRDGLGIWDTQSVSFKASENAEILVIEMPML